MTTLDDKLLGEKTHNYCSSSEDEQEPEEPASSSSSPPTNLKKSPISNSKIDINSTSRWEGYSQNTGPKGVIRDWQLYKEHEAMLKEENKRKLVEEVKKHTITCASYSDEVAAKEAVAKELAKADPDLDIDELLNDDDVLKEFINKRMDSLLRLTEQSAVPKASGQLLDIQNADDFLKIVEESDKRIPVIIHIYEGSSRICERLNECLTMLSVTYPKIQFCKVLGNCVGVSRLFRSKGVPALLVYKGGNLVGNFVQLGEELGAEFYEGDVENFLIENGVISETGGAAVVSRGADAGPAVKVEN